MFAVCYNELHSLGANVRSRVDADEWVFVGAVADIVDKLQVAGRLT
jgi:hypothetical protein